MPYAAFLWLLKLGALLDLGLLADLVARGQAGAPALLAGAFLAISAWRCLFPVRYEHNVVLHDLPMSSIFLTRTLATVSEFAWVILLAQLLWRVGGDSAIAQLAGWTMVLLVTVAEAFVWYAVLSGRLMPYFHEESCWLVMFVINTLASVLLWADATATPWLAGLLAVNIAFGAGYLPWQLINLRMIRANARRGHAGLEDHREPPSGLAEGLRRALFLRNPRRDAEAWGGWVGLSWMAGYWALLVPPWAWAIARGLSAG